MRRWVKAALAIFPLCGLPAWGQDLALPKVKVLERLLADDCGACHGMTRKGGLGPPLTPEALAGKPDDALVQTILDGRPGTPMPPWRSLLSEEDARWLVGRLKEE